MRLLRRGSRGLIALFFLAKTAEPETAENDPRVVDNHVQIIEGGVGHNLPARNASLSDMRKRRETRTRLPRSSPNRDQRLGRRTRLLKFYPLHKAIPAETSLRPLLGDGQGMRELGAPTAMLGIAGHRRVALGAKRLHRFIITCNPVERTSVQPPVAKAEGTFSSGTRRSWDRLAVSDRLKFLR